MNRMPSIPLLLACTALGVSAAAHAVDTALISDSGIGAQGVLSVNVSAGEYNQAANLRAIAVNPDGTAVAVVKGGAVQGTVEKPAIGSVQTAHIGGAAFAGFNGVLGVNQQAGRGNVSANLLGVAMGAKTGVATSFEVSHADDSLLAGNAANPLQQVLGEATSVQQVGIDSGAFLGASGVVQINQVAGNGNVTSNALAVQFSHPPGL
ncbi:hypothetical protein [Jeongeupia chitinilytica]|uniref:Adhesin n=1 Tax=Jeongeupia chitinilytica TaxID=1041641 RepID=A0ABQ3H223_9NEIS|nr:hypothetical protein [Jeongeupia chitinilytica]GHD66402.1 hypothetical protein GCM10007350_28570 [Jeongeupia chitinilytica]